MGSTRTWHTCGSGVPVKAGCSSLNALKAEILGKATLHADKTLVQILNPDKTH